jgi:proliferating cell nuclear antigen
MVFEAVMDQGSMLKRVVDAVKELVQEANIDCTPSGMSMQAMDSSHVALVHLLLRGEGFSTYNCEQNKTLGIHLNHMAKMMRISDTNDSILLRQEEDTDLLTFIFRGKEGDKESEVKMKLLEIDAEQLTIPEQEHALHVHMPASEFARLCKDMQVFGDSVCIDVNKERVKFSAQGDIGAGSVVVRQAKSADERPVKKQEVKNEEEEEPKAKKARKDGKEDEREIPAINIELMREPLAQNFALRYLNIFAKASNLSDRVKISMGKDAPLQVEFPLDHGRTGYVRYYLAPKIDEDAQADA